MNDPDGFSPEDLLDALACRHSMGPQQLVEPPVPAAHLLRAAQLARRAPDHRRLRPFRFVEVGADQREALGALFAQAARRRGADDALAEEARRRARNGPTLVAVIARLREDVPEVPVQEQWLTAGGAIMNFLNALHLLGHGAKVVSGAALRDPAVQAAFCRETGEMLVAWVLAGTPARAARPRPDDDPSEPIVRWDGLPRRGDGPP